MASSGLRRSVTEGGAAIAANAAAARSGNERRNELSVTSINQLSITSLERRARGRLRPPPARPPARV